MTVAAIVLAGGRSSRFGRDKLRRSVDGRPLVEWAIAAARSVADQVIVVVGPGDLVALPDDVTIVHDARPFEGPLAALALGLAATDAEIVLVVGGDMPSLVPAVLGRLLAALGDPVPDAAVLDDAGHRRPLPMALRRERGLTVAEALLDAGDRRLRALRDGLVTMAIPDEAWLPDDPTRATLRDVDTPDDL